MGLFFALEGGDGVGKTTQLELLFVWLEARDHNVVVCRDPGGTPLGDKLREILLHSGPETPIEPLAEMMLYMTARVQLIKQVIEPSLLDGAIVVTDRFMLSTHAYQGYGQRLGPDVIMSLEDAVIDVAPSHTFLLDMPAEKAMARITRQRDRIESRGAEYQAIVREGFLRIAGDDWHKDSVTVIDADRDPQIVHAEIIGIVSKYLN